MIVLVIAGSGMLGHKLVQRFADIFDVHTTLRGNFEDYEKFKIFAKARTFEKVDVSDIKQIEKIIDKVKPEVVVNAAGIVKQLPISADVLETVKINSIFPHRLQSLTQKYDFRLISVGTDCVFSGKKGNYKETDCADAEDVYGKSKSLGEVEGKNSLILRTSMIGRELKTRHGLLEWFLSNRGRKVKGFRRAIFNGFPTVVIADILVDLILNHKDLHGLYHLGSEPISKFDLLNLIKRIYRLDIEIEPYDEFKIDRSLDTTEFKRAADFEPLSWEAMIERMSKDATAYDDFAANKGA